MTGELHHPWRVFSRLTDWKLEWGELPDGKYGHTCHETQKVTIALGLSQAERRCTIAHETQHILRGPVPEHLEMREELLVDRLAARLLVPSMRTLVDALVWAHGGVEDAADELWVDDLMLSVRLSALWKRERDYLNRRLDEVMLLVPEQA